MTLWRLLQTILFALFLLAATYLLALVLSIAAAIAICKVLGSNPYDGGWMFGLLASPFVEAIALYLIVKNSRRRTFTPRGFPVIPPNSTNQKNRDR